MYMYIFSNTCYAANLSRVTTVFSSSAGAVSPIPFLFPDLRLVLLRLKKRILGLSLRSSSRRSGDLNVWTLYETAPAEEENTVVTLLKKVGSITCITEYIHVHICGVVMYLMFI